MSKKTEAKQKETPKEKTPGKTPPEKVPEEPKEKVEEAKPEKVEKAKPQKKKRVDKKIFTIFKIEGEKIVRLRPTCERCGTGYFMADHGNRYSCGHCGFTKYKPSEK